MSVFAVMLAEQTIVNGAVLTVDAVAADAALAGVVFSVLLIARAPLQLFQAVQGTLLPHLARLQATAGQDEFTRSVNVTLMAIAGFGLALAVGLFAVGPFALGILFDVDYDYARGGLALLALGVGCHLAAGTLNQAALARRQAGRAAAAWLAAAVDLPRVDGRRRSSTTSSCARRSATSARGGAAVRGAVGAVPAGAGGCARVCVAVSARVSLALRRAVERLIEGGRVAGGGADRYASRTDRRIRP